MQFHAKSIGCGRRRKIAGFMAKNYMSTRKYFPYMGKGIHIREKLTCLELLTYHEALSEFCSVCRFNYYQVDTFREFIQGCCKD